MKLYLQAALCFCLPALCPGQGLQGPSLLSRGMAPELRPGSPSELQPFLGTTSGYDNGLLGRDFERAGGPFQEIEGGLRAQRTGRRASVRLDYRFGLRHYTETSRLDRSNHGFSLDARVALSRRFTVVLRDTATSSSFGGNFEQAAAPAVAGFGLDAGPEALDSRTFASTVLADLVFAASPRTSLSVAGDGFVIQRQSQALIDALGWRARADFAHRYSRRRTIAVSYSFTHFDHTRSFGGADYAVYAVAHSWRLARGAEFDVYGGVGRLQSAGVRAVTLDPEIAKLLGTVRGAEIFRLNTWTPHLLAAWVQAMGRAEVRFEAARVVSDGGGLSGLARQNQGAITVSVPHARSWRPSVTLVARRYRSLDTLLYDNTTAMVGGALARRISSRVETVVRYQFAFYNFQSGLLQNFRRHQIAADVVYHFGQAAKP